jgi:acyl-CoA synthetase (NDP forming)
VGNEAMTDITDCMEYLSLCPDTKVIGLYVEGIRNGRKFFDTARRVSEKKPIVAYYIGGSESGKRAGNSHTGALAGPDQLYEGLFKQCGIIRAYSIEELFDFCYVLGTQPLPLSNQTAILTHSGGPGAAAADTAERSGLKLVDFSPITIEALTPLVPHTASLANPVDLTFSKNPSDYTETIPKILLRDEHVHNLFMYMLMPVQRVVETIRNSGVPLDQAKLLAHEYIKTQCEIVAGLSREFKKPVVGGSFYSRDEQFIRNLQDLGAAVLPSPERAMKALAALVRYAEGRDRLLRMSE